MILYNTQDGKTFKTQEEARAHSKAINMKLINKIMLNSHYGFLPGSLAQKLGRQREWKRSQDERASIWRRIFGEPKPKPRRYTPLPGGASLQFASSTVVTLYPKTKAEDITKTGQLALAKLLEKFPHV